MSPRKVEEEGLWDLLSMQALKNDRQRRFVAEYLKDSCGAQAAIRAGYSPNCARQQAWDLLTRPDIKAALDVVRAQFAERLHCTVESVLQRLVDVSLEAREAHHYSAAIRSLELLGRHFGMFDKRRSELGASSATEVEEGPVEETNRTEAERLGEFAQDIRMLATQRQALGVSVEDFLDDIEDMVAEGCAARDRAQ